jgi:flagellar biosynthetic protein FliR
MTAFGPESVLGVFVLFCRIGAAMLLMPGVSSTQIPVQVRLFLAIALSLALAPLLLPSVRRAVAGAEPLALLWIIAGELLVGLLIGLLARVFFVALQALAAALATSIGYSGIPGSTIDEAEPMPALVSLITVSAVVLMFQTDLHWEVLRGLAASYAVLPPGTGYESRFGLTEIADQLSETFLVALRISSPFLVYAIVANFAVGIANKLVPQISVYFVSLPLILAGGLFILYFNIDELLSLFTAEFGRWSTTG